MSCPSGSQKIIRALADEPGLPDGELTDENEMDLDAGWESLRVGQKQFQGNAADPEMLDDLTKWLMESMEAERVQVAQFLQTRHAKLLSEWSRITSQASPARPEDTTLQMPSTTGVKTPSNPKDKKKKNRAPKENSASDPPPFFDDDLLGESSPAVGCSSTTENANETSPDFGEANFSEAKTSNVVDVIKRDAARAVLAWRSSEQLFAAKDDSFLRELTQLVSSARFELFFSALIILSSFVMALQIQYEGFQMGHEEGFPRCGEPASKRWPGMDRAITIISFTFGICFVIEVLLKIAGQRIDFPKSFWNCFDTLVSLTWILYELGYSIHVNPAILRLLRIARLFRMVRLARTIAAFDVLQLIVGSIQASIGVLVWSLVCLSFLMMTAGMLMNSLLVDYIKADDSTKKLQVYQRFGTFSRAMVTMWEITLGNWVPTAHLLMDNVSEWYALFFLLWRGIVSFAIITTIRGVFLHETFKAVEADRDIMIMQKQRTLQKTRKYMLAFFAKMDTSGDGFISLDEFKELTQDPRMKAWISAMDMDVSDAEEVFTLMDDGDGQVSADELLNGIARLKGTAKSLDVCQLAHKVSHIEDCVIKIHTLVDGDLSDLNKPMVRRFQNSANVSSQAM